MHVKRLFGPACAVIAALLCLCPGRCRASATQWTGRPGRNAASPAEGLPEELSDQNKLWEFKVRGGAQFAIPTVVGDSVLVGTQQRSLLHEELQHLNRKQSGSALMCLDLSTGELRWELLLRGLGTNHSYGRYGLCDTPVIDGDRAYVVDPFGNFVCVDLDGQADGNDGPFRDEAAYMACRGFHLLRGEPYDGPLPAELKPTYGDILWKYEFLEKHGVVWQHAHSGTPLVDGPFVYLPTSNSQHWMLKADGRTFSVWGEDRDQIPEDHPRGKGCPNMLVFNKRTGTLVATDKVRVPGIYHGQWSSPSMGQVGGRKLLFYGDGYGVLHAYAALETEHSVAGEVRTLEEVWRFDCVPAEFREKGYGELEYTHRGRSAAPRVAEKLKVNIIATPVFHDNRVYVALGRDPNYGITDGILWCIDAGGTGDVTGTACVWRDEEVKSSLATVAIADGLLYFIDTAGVLRCYDAETGHRHWEKDLEADDFYCDPLVADGRIYVSTERHHWVLKAGTEVKVLGRTRVRGSEPRTPGVTDGLLLVPTNRTLTAYVGPGYQGPRPAKDDTEPQSGTR